MAKHANEDPEPHPPGDDEEPLIHVPREHPEVVAWLDGLRRFSRGLMVLAGAVLAGVAQLAGELQSGPDGAKVSGMSALVFSMLCIFLGYFVERASFEDVANRFGLVFREAAVGGSRLNRMWGLQHAGPDDLPLVKGSAKGQTFTLETRRTHLTASGLAGSPKASKRLVQVQAMLWFAAAVQYAVALGWLMWD